MKNIESLQRKRIVEKRKKKITKKAIRNGIAFLGVFMVVIGVVMFRNSFAFFKKEIVAGNVDIRIDELVYDLKSESLTNNQITVEAGKSITFEVEITSKNLISSKYELYYNVNDETDFGIGYMENTVDAVSRVIDANGKKTVTIKIVNDGTSSKTITLGVEGGLERNELELTKGKRISTVYKDLFNPACVPVTVSTDTSGASEPVIKGDMIPIVYDECERVWKKADITQTWYNYDTQTWANAVIPLDKTIPYEVGEVVPEENIESYFVWIPRYRYKIFNEGNYSGLSSSLNPNAPQTIEIEFESKDTSISSGSTVGSWLTHPAFTAFNTNGIWVGKFESSGSSAQLKVKPNVSSWRNITVGNAFQVSYDYKRNLESHMMKNTEWGAVTYLSHSKYGKNGEVYINNNSTFLTGCGGDTASEGSISTCKNAYNSKEDNVYNQSTTGNITGIFDMSGGAHEYVMGNNKKSASNSEITSIYSDFFTNSVWSKYYDLYSSNSDTSYSSRILGDATGEMGPFSDHRGSWYDDYSYSIYHSIPWILRGSDCSGTSNAGIFTFDGWPGGANSNFSFRIVLAL